MTAPAALLLLLLCAVALSTAAAGASGTVHGCECLQFTSTESGDVFEGCHPTQKFCDVKTGCPGAKDVDAGLSYGGWDECVPGVAEGAAPVLVDASGLQNLANLAEAPTTELGAAATEVDMRVEPAVEVDEAKTDVQVEVLDLSSLKEEVLDLSSFKEEVPAEEAATELTEVDEAATEVPAASKAEKPPPDTMRVSQQGRVISVEGGDVDMALRKLVRETLQGEHGSDAEKMFESLDTDGDGNLVQKEINSLVPMPDLLADIEKLKAAASEGGSPDKASLQLIKEKAMASAIRRSKLFKIMDTNQDRKVTAEEFGGVAHLLPHGDL